MAELAHLPDSRRSSRSAIRTAGARDLPPLDAASERARSQPRRVSSAVRNAWVSRRCGASPTRGSPRSRLSRRAMPCTCSTAARLVPRGGRVGARILAIEERNARAAPRRVSRRRSASAPTSTSCARARARSSRRRSRRPRARINERKLGLVACAIDAAVPGPALFASGAANRVARPLVAIGAPVGAITRRSRAGSEPLSIPVHAAVCNAVGAVAGVVSQTVEVLVNQPTFKVFRVHDPAGSRDYPDRSRRSSTQSAPRASSHWRRAACRRGRSARRDEQ